MKVRVSPRLKKFASYSSKRGNRAIGRPRHSADRNDGTTAFSVIASERFDFAHRPEFIEGAKQSHSQLSKICQTQVSYLKIYSKSFLIILLCPSPRKAGIKTDFYKNFMRKFFDFIYHTVSHFNSNILYIVYF